MTKTTSSRKGLSFPPTSSFDFISAQQRDKIAQNTTESPAQSTVQPPKDGLEIVHATTGRVRIRATDGSHNSVLNTISQNLQQQDGVKEVYAFQQGMIVTFDEKKLSLPQILALLQQYGIEQPAQKAIKTDPFAAWKSLDFWKEQGISFIPMFTGLAVTGRLGIHGLASIPVYLITANATRGVIGYFEPKLSGSQTSLDANTASAKKHNKTPQESLLEVKHTSTIRKEKSTDVVATASTNGEPDAQTTKIAYSVVHAIPGRIRLNVPRLASDRAYARRLERLLKTDPQVTSVRMNCDAASVAITYKSGDIAVSHWVALMLLADKTIPQTISIKTTTEEAGRMPTPQEQVSQPTEPKEATDVTLQPVSVNLAEIWADFKPPALREALAFMANFPLELVA